MNYDLYSYNGMLIDPARTNAYVNSLKATVAAGATVLDIGTGTGFFAVMACRCGAGRVYAIEPSDCIQVARELAAANGVADRIQFHEGLSTQIDLPDRADVIVADLRGALPIYDGNLSSMIDARARLLKPGGTMIPQEDTLWISLVEAPELYRGYQDSPIALTHGVNMVPSRQRMVNSYRRVKMTPDQILVEPRCLARLDYRTIQTPDLESVAAWIVNRPGTLHGLGLWFDAVLAGGFHYSNAPGPEDPVYGRAFFPLTSPLSLAAGDSVAVRIRANLVGDDYVWQWKTRVVADGGSGATKAAFDQCTFRGESLTPSRIRKRSASFLPALNEKGEADRFVLNQIAEGGSLQRIAELLVQQYPQQFATMASALARVADLSEKYSR